MPTFAAADGTTLAYREVGEGAPVLCVAGGPMRDSAYLGDLGRPAGLALVLLDLRGTGRSAVPADPTSYRCDRLVDDVEALREHLGLEKVNLLGHSAGTNIAVQYAARYPGRIGTLILVTPSTRAVGIEVSTEERLEVVALRAGEPWFERASAALERLNGGRAQDGDMAAMAPFRYGRWDATAQADAADAQHRNAQAAAQFGADGAFDPPATRAALAKVEAPVLLVAGEFDANSPPGTVAKFTALFPGTAVFTSLAGSGHFPWLDVPAAFAEILSTFVTTSGQLPSDGAGEGPGRPRS